MNRMTWEQFEDKYQFESDENGSKYFEFDSDRVKEIEDKYGDEAWRYIWTWCSEGSDEYFVAGYALVNRLNYMIATVPHDLESPDVFGEGDSVEIVEDYAELSKEGNYAKFDLWIDDEFKKVEIFAEQNIDGYVWFSLAINEEVMETSEYKDWNPEEDHEEEKGEFDFDKLVKTELKGNRYLGRNIIVGTFMEIMQRRMRNED
jgi:hypothetical protein